MTETAEEVTPSSDVAVPATATEQRVAQVAWGVDPDRDFAKLALEAQYYSKGFRLVDKSVLINVPHVIIGVTYRPGYVASDGSQSDYVSIEAVVANKETLESTPIRNLLGRPIDQLEVFPNESVVYNDGSTGVRRELTGLFHSIGLIDVGTPASKNENPFDRSLFQWMTGAEEAQLGFTADKDGNPFRFIVARGLRRSDYESPYGPATTFYIA